MTVEVVDAIGGWTCVAICLYWGCKWFMKMMDF